MSPCRIKEQIWKTDRNNAEDGGGAACLQILENIIGVIRQVCDLLNGLDDAAGCQLGADGEGCDGSEGEGGETHLEVGGEELTVSL